MTAVQTISI